MKLLLLFMLQAMVASLAFAQGPIGASNEGEISYEKRLNHLRSDLRSNWSTAPRADAPAPAARQLTLQERAQLRQQLREQYKPISQPVPIKGGKP